MTTIAFHLFPIVMKYMHVPYSMILSKPSHKHGQMEYYI